MKKKTPTKIPTIEKTYIPFHPMIRTRDESVFYELMQAIQKIAKQYKKNLHDFSASFEVLPDPRGKKYGHFSTSTVVYRKGKLS